MEFTINENINSVRLLERDKNLCLSILGSSKCNISRIFLIHIEREMSVFHRHQHLSRLYLLRWRCCSSLLCNKKCCACCGVEACSQFRKSLCWVTSICIDCTASTVWLLVRCVGHAGFCCEWQCWNVLPFTVESSQNSLWYKLMLIQTL